ncbi:Nucleoporin nup49/NSP49 (Nuclear pore protein nup49/NSP49) [Paramarasmius palmivorus]|uniref:Nucleoporin nup49/NSP49 (Nuclear pore protein nup49/NSP49) n=1 Tax=Paramarasmius palmivorus TaxID=297713 RepID=A0AAW0C179_9AGAR
MAIHTSRFLMRSDSTDCPQCLAKQNHLGHPSSETPNHPLPPLSLEIPQELIPEDQLSVVRLLGNPNNSSSSQQPAAGSSIFGQSTGGTGTGTGLFGQSTQQQQGGTGTGTGLFGQSNQQQAGGTGTGLFGQSNTGTGTGLFGQNNQQQQPAAAGNSIFGQNAQQPAAGTSLFGQNNQQQGGSNLFGNTQQNNTTGGGLFGNNQQATGNSLFGQNNQTTNTGGGLFGQNTQTSNTGGGLFGQNNQNTNTSGGIFGQNNQQNAGGTGIFGQTQQGQANTGFGQPQQNAFGGGNSIFGNNAGANTGSNLFGSTQQSQLGGTGSMFGKPLGQQSQINTQQPPPFTKTTKFNDLPDQLKKVFEDIDAHIQGRVQISKDLKQRKLGEEPTKGQELVRAVHRDLSQTSTTIRNDLHFTRDLKAKADQAVQDTIIATRIIDGFKNPQLNGGYLKDHATFPLEFFARITRQTKERLAWYKATIEQIERKLSSMATQQNITPQRITSTLQAQHATFLALASRTAALDAELQKIKALYTQLWRARTGSVRDPFDGGADIEQSLGGGDLGLSSLNVR